MLCLHLKIFFFGVATAIKNGNKSNVRMITICFWDCELFRPATSPVPLKPVNPIHIFLSLISTTKNCMSLCVRWLNVAHWLFEWLPDSFIAVLARAHPLLTVCYVKKIPLNVLTRNKTRDIDETRKQCKISTFSIKIVVFDPNFHSLDEKEHLRQ